MTCNRLIYFSWKQNTTLGVCKKIAFVCEKKQRQQEQQTQNEWQINGNKKVIQFYFQLSKKKYLISSHLHWIHFVFFMYILNEYARTKFFKTSKSIFVHVYFVNACDCNQYKYKSDGQHVYFRQPHAIRYLECHNKIACGLWWTRVFVLFI